ncbi:MAG: thiol-disulfide oxidoreductase DCC family protein [Halobacteriales archaeon]|nr:thiol-disulfide oxidoreductase DCC family protein [Halobacteriales archaeon]
MAQKEAEDAEDAKGAESPESGGESDSRPVILFDGVCNLCNSFVNFVMDRDGGAFRFASIQSDVGAELMRDAGLSPEELETFVVVDGDTDDGNVYTKSTAALYVLRRLGLPYSLLYVFVIVPPFLRNPFYDFVASRRYSWFGKRDECRVPDEETKDRFLSYEEF